MVVAIIDYEHFQLVLAISELFEGHKKIFVVSQSIHDSMLEYAPNLANGEFIINEQQELKQNYLKISNELNESGVDLFVINPVFTYFNGFYALMKKLNGVVLFTIHCLNYWFRPNYHGPKSLRERIVKRKILNLADYIVVEDFLFQYIIDEKPSFIKGRKILFIPSTLFTERIIEKETPVNMNNRLKVVLTGAIDIYRRNYEQVLDIIDRFADQNESISFSFAGPAIGEYGQEVLKRLKKANEKSKGIAIYFEKQPTYEQFKHELENADIILSTINKYFDGLGTRDYYGKTKSTGVIHDMISFELPGFLPSHLNIPQNLKSSTISYKGVDDLFEYLLDLINDKSKLEILKAAAKENSLKYTAEKIRLNLPFFNLQERNVRENEQ